MSSIPEMLIFLLFVSLCTANNYYEIGNDITIPQGKLKGSINYSGTIRRFLGIPYATAPGRFKESVPASPWNRTYDATQHSPTCRQPMSISNDKNNLINVVVGNDDCLVVNVYAPIVATSGPRPVLVFIHGGGFIWGSNSDYVLDPKYLVEKNVVVVTINYRLGALGFLCLRNEGAPGNVGLKDQVLALKWIKKNIQFFGGDPDSITLFGQDVGAASINYFLLTNSTQGLFHRAILQSGSMLMPQAFDDNPIESASKVAAEIGLQSTDPDELLEFFENIPIEELVKTSTADTPDDPFAAYKFRPCVEAPHEGVLITKNPRNILKSAKLRPGVQVIIGYNDQEGLQWASQLNYSSLSGVIDNLKHMLPDYLEIPEEKKYSFMQDVRRMYFDVDETDSYEVTNGMIDYFSDVYIRYPSLAMSEYLLDAGVTVFNYVFGYFSTRNYGKLSAAFTTFYNKLSQPIYQYQGASHGDELFYLFDSLLQNSWPPMMPNDAVMIYRMTMMWSYFALNGNPTIPEDSRLPYPVKWTESQTNDIQLLDIFVNFQMKPVSNKTRIDFWKKSYEKYGKY